MISQKRKDAFVQARMQKLMPHLKGYGSANEIRLGIEEEFDELLGLSDIRVCQKREEFFKLEQVEASDYKERIIHLGNESILSTCISKIS